nr:aminoacyl-tRNA hydrolase [Saprospiraceae bacterium]
MKYLITGLGNMGPDYEGTRHNIGFEVADHLAERFEVTFKDNQLGFTAEFKHKGRTIHLLKPTTYMNRSGKAIRYWMTKLKIPVDRTMVILDDVHLDLGVIKLKPGGSDGGHNGLKNIQQLLSTNKYPRLRIGIGRDFHPGQQVDYVLGKWEKSELETIQTAVAKAGEAVLDFTSIGIQRTMNKVN